MGRAPKGGTYIKGIFYKGGQFLPADEPMRGKYNGKASKRGPKVRKLETAPYVWEIAPEGKISLFSHLAGTVGRYNRETKQLTYCANEQILKFRGMTEETAKALIARFNSGEKWY